jgi:hypothetical protein
MNTNIRTQHVQIRNKTFTRGNDWLIPSDWAPVLQHGSGPSCDFLAKLLSTDTAPFSWRTQFYFLLSSLLLHSLGKCNVSFVTSDSSVGNAIFMAQPTPAAFRFKFILISVEITAMNDAKLNLFLGLCM